MPGNSLGKRGWYEYVSESGTTYSILTDNDLAAAAGMTANGTFPNLPRRFEPRIVHCEAVIAGQKVRKRLICPTNDNTLYALGTTQNVVIDGTTFKTTGRVGEKMSFPSTPI